MILSVRSIRAALAAPAVAALLLTAGAAWSAPASAATCNGPVDYPGDKASANAYANWMANGAAAIRLPGELPVMAGLVESGLENLNYGDADSVGFFQMRTSIWDKGVYKGYLKNPALQLKWFLDQAVAVRAGYKSAGKADPAASEKTYGVWIADIERPAAQYRGRYQLRLKDAQTLIKATCPGLQGINVTAPVSHLSIARKQHPARTGAISVGVKCLDVSCLAGVTATFTLPGRRGTIKLSSDTAMIAPGSKATVKIPLPHSVRSSIRKRLPGRTTTTARLRISVANTASAGNVFVRKISLAR